jgi:hypothetical protein
MVFSICLGLDVRVLCRSLRMSRKRLGEFIHLDSSRANQTFRCFGHALQKDKQ